MSNVKLYVDNVGSVLWTVFDSHMTCRSKCAVGYILYTRGRVGSKTENVVPIRKGSGYRRLYEYAAILCVSRNRKPNS